EVDYATMLVDGNSERPVVVARSIFLAVITPRVIAGFAGERNGVKVPQLLSGARVVGVDVALLAFTCCELRSDVPFARPEEIRSHQDGVPVDNGHSGVGDFQIDVAPVAELDVKPAGVGVKGDQFLQ